MSHILDMCEAYFITIEEQVIRFETVASKLEDEDKAAILDIATGLRKEVQALHEQIDLSAEWG